MTITEITQILAATIGSLGFAVLFNIRGAKLIAVSLGGGFAWTLFLLLDRFIQSELLSYFVVALSVSFYAELMARVLKSPATVFIAPCLIPMVPGASLYYTMAHALSDDLQGFIEKGTSTVQLAAALAVGIIVSTVVMRFITNTVWFFKARKRRQI